MRAKLWVLMVTAFARTRLVHGSSAHLWRSFARRIPLSGRRNYGQIRTRHPIFCCRRSRWGDLAPDAAHGSVY